MKWSDLIIIFVLITIPFHMFLEIQTRSIEQALNKKVELDHMIDTAVEDGVSVLIERGEGAKTILNKEKCLMSFYNTLFINLGIMDDPFSKSRVMGYIPVIAIIDYDGFYIIARESFLDKDHYTEVKGVVQPKKMFAYSQDNFVYGFTLDDYERVYDIHENKFFEGKQEDLKDQINAPLLQDGLNFDNKRRRVIVEELQREINIYINRHNDIARQYGINYQFALPVIADEDWYQTVDDIGMLVFFQGLPMGIDLQYYNNYAFGGAQVIKKEGVFIQENPLNGIRYYHRETCIELKRKEFFYNSREKAALEGVFPCKHCRP